MILGDQVRHAEAGITSVDAASRTMVLSFSSETPTSQKWGREVLSHDPGACDLSRLNAGAPVLFRHDKSDVRGVVESASIGADRRGRAIVRFSKNPKGADLLRDVNDGIIRGVSVGYSIQEMKQTGGTSKEPEYRVTKWRPNEITITPFPADHTVGIGREVGRERLYAEPIKHLPDERTIMNNAGSYVIDANAPEMRNFSLTRALASFAENGHTRGSPEKEISDQIAKALKRGTNGLFIPTNLPAIAGQRATSTTAYAATTGSQGGASLVATDLLSGSFIDVLRNKSRVMQAGATVLPGLVGNIAIPRQDTASTAYWLNPEGADITESEGTFDQVSMSPKTIGVYSQITRQLLLSATPAVEALVRNDLARSLALGIDFAALAGTGAAGQPLGILSTPGINTVAIGPNGGASSIDNLIALETDVALSNVDDETLAYLTNAKVIGGWKSLKDTTGRYLWADNTLDGQWGQRGNSPMPGAINGYPVFRTNQVPMNLTKGSGTGLSAIVFGAWADLLIAEWGVMEIDTSVAGAGFRSGTLEYRALQSVDITLRHPQSFAVITDATQ